MVKRNLLVLLTALLLVASPALSQETENTPYLTEEETTDTAFPETTEDTPVSMEAGDSETQFQLGYNAFRDGNLREAISRLRRALDSDSSYTRARYWLGRFYYANGQNDSALMTWENHQPASGMDDSFQREINMHHERYSEDNFSLDSQWQYAGIITGTVHGEERLTNPNAIEPAPGGGWYVSSYQLGKVIRYSTEGDVLEIYEGFEHPVDLLYREDRGLLVLNGEDGAIDLISDTGEIRRFGEGVYSGAQKLLESGNRMYVFDIGASEITQISTSGETIASIWSGGPQRDVNDVTVGPGGNFWVLDGAKPEMLVLNQYGAVINRVPLDPTLRLRRIWWRKNYLFGAGSQEFVRIDPETGETSGFEVSQGELSGEQISDVVVDGNYVIVALFEQSGLAVYRTSDSGQYDLLVQPGRTEFNKFPIIRMNLLLEDNTGMNRFKHLRDQHLSLDVDNQTVLPSLLRHSRSIYSANWIMIVDNRMDRPARLDEIRPRLLDFVSASPGDVHGSLWTVSDGSIKQASTRQNVLLRNALRRVQVDPGQVTETDTGIEGMLELALDSAFKRRGPMGIILVSRNLPASSPRLKQIAQRFRNNLVPLILINPSSDTVKPGHPLRDVAPSRYFDFNDLNLKRGWIHYNQTLRSHYTVIFKSSLSYQISNEQRPYQLIFELFDQTIRYDGAYLIP